MQSTPDVSVVMGVYNGASNLSATLDSILRQSDCNFEFIVVNDGSTDSTHEILGECAAKDPRLMVINQENLGLTKALIAGCAAASGRYIARQDCGDISLPGRLAAQMAMLDADPETVMVASGVNFLAPRGEVLNCTIRAGQSLHEGLAQLDVRHIHGPPHHGGTMFRTSDYVAVGGYRDQFVVAQDMDLWLRLAERGRCLGQDGVCYVANLEPGSISSRRRNLQFTLAELAIQCALLRRAGQSDQDLLDIYDPRPSEFAVKPKSPRSAAAGWYYFIGSCLLQKGDRRAANKYFFDALRQQPYHLKSLWRLLLGAIL